MGFLRYLITFGSIRGLAVIDDDLPPLEELDPEKCYLGFDFAFSTSEPRERIEGAFDFVREDSTLKLVPPNSPPNAYFDTLRTAGLNAARSARVLKQCGSLTAAEIEQVLHPAESAPAGDEATAGLDESARSNGNSTPQMPEPTLHSASSSGQSAPRVTLRQTQAVSTDDRTIRVDANKLDHLITHIGELITLATTANLNAYHESGTIVIEVSDDGGGLERERILAKAVERGLIAPGQVPGDTDVLNLVFEPGFSTAENEARAPRPYTKRRPPVRPSLDL